MAETATVMVLLALIGNVAILSVGIGGFKDVLGISGNSNDGTKISEKIIAPVRSVCAQGSNADKRSNTFTLSSTINVTLVSEGQDTLQDQSIRAMLAEDKAQLIESEPIGDCVIEFGSGPKTYHVFEKEQPYEVTIENQGSQQDKPATSISVEER